jgi:hypothetical protein
MRRFLEQNQVQLGLMQALNNTNVTGRYFDIRKWRRVTAILTVLSMAATKTAKIELVQDKDGDGGDVKAITGAEKTVTANTSVVEATVTLSTFLESGTITINGVTFTAHADTTTVANREFAIDGNDTADAAALVTCINDATYGVTGVTASSNAGVVTLVADDGYTITVSSTPDDATCVKATVEAIAEVDISVEDVDTANGFHMVAPKVTTTANATAVSVVLIKGEAYHSAVDAISPATIL